MSDPTAVLLAAAQAALSADAAVLAAMGDKPRFYSVAPRNPPQGSAKPYAILSAAVAPRPAQCFASAVVDLTVDIWSLTDPPSTGEAIALAAACLAVLVPEDDDGTPGAPDWTLSGHVLKDATHLGTDHLTDPADQSAHSILRVQFETDAA